MPITATRRGGRIRIDLGVEDVMLDRGLARARKKLKGFAGDVGKVFRGGGRAMGKIGGGLLMGAGMGAVGGLSEIVTGVVDFEKALTRFQIAAKQTPEQIAAFRDEVTKTSTETGIARSELLSGASAYVALTGDAAGATKQVGMFAKVANATGASMADIATTAAAFRDNLHLDPSEFEAAFSALHVQGKEGAVELRELAALLSSIAPSFAQFHGGTGAGGIARLGASLQVVRKGFGSSTEAATGLQSLMVAVTKNAAKFEKAGVKVFTKDPKTGKKQLNGLLSIVAAIGESKLAKDPTLLQKAFGRDEAKRAYDQLIQNKGLLDSLVAASSDASAIQKDAAIFQESAAGKLQIALETLKNSIAETFTPERIEAFVSAVGALVDKLGQAAAFVGWIADGLPGHRNATAAEKKLGGSVNSDPLMEIREQNRINQLRATASSAPFGLGAQMTAEADRAQQTLNAIQVADTDTFNRKQLEALRAELAPTLGVSNPDSGRRGVDAMSLQELQQAKRDQQQLDRLRVQVSATLQVDGKEIATSVKQSRDARTAPGGR